ncbi:MAG TPA: DUF1080 domain-containing protein [Hyphomicrobiales bacterium]|nr:DUF1080 domain-containing protein [Hyphomicrobiales bacterium]
MPTTSASPSCLFAFLLMMSLPAAAQEDALFAAGLDEWQVLGGEASSFAFEGDTLSVSGSDGWLRSPRTYGDFELSGQVRFVEPDADSGIFLRVVPGTDFIRGWPGNAYQVQMRDISRNTSDRPLPLLQLYRHQVPDGNTTYAREQVLALYGGVGEWQHFRIRAQGNHLQVWLNDELVTEAEDLANATGYLGFQSETGTVQYRALRLREE